MALVKNQYNCPIVLAMDLIGGKWKILILWYLNQGTKRFNEIKKSLPNITQKILTQQLREMEENHLIERKAYAEMPPRVEYCCTEYGKKLQAVLSEMNAWGNDYAENHNVTIRSCSGS